MIYEHHPVYIQTNHGVSFPLVGPKRAEQRKLFKSNDKTKTKNVNAKATQKVARKSA